MRVLLVLWLSTLCLRTEGKIVRVPIDGATKLPEATPRRDATVEISLDDSSTPISRPYEETNQVVANGGDKTTGTNGSQVQREVPAWVLLRTLWSEFTPMISLASAMLGVFLTFILVESPLSPLPVPPLPYPPVGPYPPTNQYPFGIPPMKRSVPWYGVPSPEHSGRYNRRGRLVLDDAMSSGSREWSLRTMENALDDLINRHLSSQAQSRHDSENQTKLQSDINSSDQAKAENIRGVTGRLFGHILEEEHLCDISLTNCRTQGI